MSLRKNDKSTSGGYTIVEILVVCGIVAILVGTIFACMGPAMEKSRQTVCTSNLKQLYTAISIYREEYSGQDPSAGIQMKFSEMGLPTGDFAFSTYFVPLLRRVGAFCPDSLKNKDNPGLATSYFTYPCVGSQPESPAWVTQGASHWIFLCKEHNAKKEPWDNPTYEPFRILSIALDGTFRNVVSPASKVAIN